MHIFQKCVKDYPSHHTMIAYWTTRRLLLVLLLLVATRRGLAWSPPPPPPLPHISVRFENEHLVVIDKPPNLAHHDRASRRDDNHNDDGAATTMQGNDNDVAREKGVLTLLRQQQQQDSKHSDDDYPLYGVHRLDVVTSGLLVVAKTTDMARCLTQAFTDRHVVKYYTGLSAKPAKKKKQGWINGYMQRGRRKSWYLTKKEEANNNNASAWAKTYFWTAGLGQLAEFYQTTTTMQASKEECNSPNVIPRTLILFRPYTGRTHQLRVASKSVGLVLLGDPLYTTARDTIIKTPNDAQQLLVPPRTCLHATGLHIPKECLEKAGMKQDLTLWSPPPFLDWWQPGNRPNVAKLLQKDATVPTSLLEKAVMYTMDT